MHLLHRNFYDISVGVPYLMYHMYVLHYKWRIIPYVVDECFSSCTLSELPSLMILAHAHINIYACEKLEGVERGGASCRSQGM